MEFTTVRIKKSWLQKLKYIAIQRNMRLWEILEEIVALYLERMDFFYEANR